MWMSSAGECRKTSSTCTAQAMRWFLLIDFWSTWFQLNTLKSKPSNQGPRRTRCVTLSSGFLFRRIQSLHNKYIEMIVGFNKHVYCERINTVPNCFGMLYSVACNSYFTFSWSAILDVLSLAPRRLPAIVAHSLPGEKIYCSSLTTHLSAKLCTQLNSTQLSST